MFITENINGPSTEPGICFSLFVSVTQAFSLFLYGRIYMEKCLVTDLIIDAISSIDG